MDLLTYGSRLPEWIVQFDSDFKTIKPSARGLVDLTCHDHFFFLEEKHNIIYPSNHHYFGPFFYNFLTDKE